MSAVVWRSRMREAPRLVHDTDGLVLVQLGERSVVFPSEVDARFFFAAYTDIQRLTDEAATLRGWIDEAALSKAQVRNVELAAEVERLKHERDALHAQLVAAAESTARATRRAKVMAHALKNAVQP